MSILSVEHLSHGFGDRAIFEDVSFRLLKGEHIGLIGANGEGKSTFMSIVTGRLQPDDGKVEWSPRVRAGYLDQHANLAPGMSIRDALRAAFSWLFELEGRMNEICDLLGSADEAQMDAYMAELSEIQELLDAHDFYLIDTKVEEVARALGLTALGKQKCIGLLPADFPSPSLRPYNRGSPYRLPENPHRPYPSIRARTHSIRLDARCASSKKPKNRVRIYTSCPTFLEGFSLCRLKKMSRLPFY